MEPIGYGPAIGITRLVEPPRVLTAAATTVTFSNLRGNHHQTYLWRHRILGYAGGAFTVTFRPNGLTTNQRCSDVEFSGAVVTATAAADLRITDVSANTIASTQGVFWAATGLQRTYIADGIRVIAAGNPIQKRYAGVWEESSTEVTSIEFVSNAASGMEVGSVFELYYVVLR